MAVQIGNWLASGATLALHELQPVIPSTMWQNLFHSFLLKLQHTVNTAGRSFSSGVFVIDLSSDHRLREFVNGVLSQCTPRLIARTHRKFVQSKWATPLTAQMEFLLNPPLQVQNVTKRVALMYTFEVTLPTVTKTLMFLKLEGANAISFRHAASAAEYYSGRSIAQFGPRATNQHHEQSLARRENIPDTAGSGHQNQKAFAHAFALHSANSNWYETIRRGREMFIPAALASRLTPLQWEPTAAHVYQ